MKIPDFDEFIKSIPKERYDYIVSGIAKDVKKGKTFPDMIAESCTASIHTTFALLSYYHQWLREYLEDQN